MDPDACLDEIRDIVKRRFYESQEDPDFDRLLELNESLDGWLTKGGSLPKAWNRGGSDGSHQTR